MAVTIKSAKEIELMREAGRLLEIVHDEMGNRIRPGISTMDINEFGDKLIRKLGCVPNFLNYGGVSRIDLRVGQRRSGARHTQKGPDSSGRRYRQPGCRTDL